MRDIFKSALKTVVVIWGIIGAFGVLVGVIYMGWTSLYHGPGSESGITGFKNYVIVKDIYQYTNPTNGEVIDYYFGSDGGTYTMDGNEEVRILLPLKQFMIEGEPPGVHSGGTTAPSTE